MSKIHTIYRQIAVIGRYTAHNIFLLIVKEVFLCPVK